MNLKKVLVGSLVAIGVCSSEFFMQSNAQAATWHHGVPSFLKHSFYRTKLEPKYFYYGKHRVKNSNLRRYEGIRTHGSTLYFEGAQYNMTLKRCRYTKKGKLYTIKGKYGKSQTETIKIKKNSAKVLHVNTGNASGSERMTKIK